MFFNFLLKHEFWFFCHAPAQYTYSESLHHIFNHPLNKKAAFAWVRTTVLCCDLVLIWVIVFCTVWKLFYCSAEIEHSSYPLWTTANALELLLSFIPEIDTLSDEWSPASATERIWMYQSERQLNMSQYHFLFYFVSIICPLKCCFCFYFHSDAHSMKM